MLSAIHNMGNLGGHLIGFRLKFHKTLRLFPWKNKKYYSNAGRKEIGSFVGISSAVACKYTWQKSLSFVQTSEYGTKNAFQLAFYDLRVSLKKKVGILCGAQYWLQHNDR